MSATRSMVVWVSSIPPDRAAPATAAAATRPTSRPSNKNESPRVWWGSDSSKGWESCRYLRKFPQEPRERSVRLVRETMSQETPLSLNAAVIRVGHRVGVNSDTLRGWVKQARIDAGEVAGVTTTDAATHIQTGITVGHQDLRTVGDLDITHRPRRSSLASTTNPECHQPDGRVQLAVATPFILLVAWGISSKIERPLKSVRDRRRPSPANSNTRSNGP